MADNNGWIKLHRKLLDNPVVMKDPDHLAVWIYLLLNASHAEYPVLFKGKKIMLQPGQLITGRKSIASTMCISESKVTRVLEMLESEQQIEQQTSNKNRLISILNWDEYQNSEQQLNNKKCKKNTKITLPHESFEKIEHQNEQQENHDNDVESSVSSDSSDESEQQNEQQLNINRTTTEQQLNTNKKIKKVKKVKEDKEIIYSDSPELNDAILAFIDYRKSIKKPMTERAVSLLLGKLSKMSNSIPEQIEILNQSIMNGWQGIFPLKPEKGSGRTEQVPSYIKNNSFNRFPQNEYDFDALEKELLANGGDP